MKDAPVSLAARALAGRPDLVQEQMRVNGEGMAEMRASRDYYAGLIEDMQRAVVTVDGQRRTLYGIFEAGTYDALCLVCRDADCNGCPITDPADIETWETDR